VRTGGRDDGGAGEEEFEEGRRACDGEVEGEVFGGEDEAGEMGRGAADGAEVGQGFGGLD